MKASAGDSNAFDELYRLKLRTILFHVSRLIKNAEDVEDVAQEVGIQMYRGIAALRNPEAFNGWMQRIVTNECYRYLRKNTRKTDQLNIDDFVNIIEEEKKEFLPKECLESEELKRVIMEAIDRLPPKRKRAIIMYYYDDMSTKEIAYALGISLATVSTNIMRGKKMIRGELEKKMGAERKQSAPGGRTIVGQILAGSAAVLYPDSSIDVMAQAFGHAIGDTPFALAQTKLAVGGAKAATSAKVGTAVTVKTIAILTGCAVVISISGHGIAQHASNTPTGSDTGAEQRWASATVTEGADITSMKIAFLNGECECGHLNPKAADLEGVSSEAVQTAWIVTDPADGRIIGEGVGLEVTQLLTALYDEQRDGLYRLTFRCTADDGHIYTLDREFVIDTGEIAPGEYE